MKKLILLWSFVFSIFAGYARGGKDSVRLAEERMLFFVDSVNSALKWEKGSVTISNGIAKLNIPAGFKFLNATQSQYVLEDIWGNLKDNTVLGMIFPEDAGAFSDSSFAYIVTFDEMGYVKDDDADDITYTDLLKNLKEDAIKSNEERRKLGMEPFNLIGWAQTPYYDKTNKVLHWAKEYQSANSDEHTLNYDIRILGRKGVLSINAVAGMSLLPMVKSNTDKILKMAEFTAGNQYKDFDSKIDNVAAWTIGGLVAGKVLAKAGLWALIAKFGKVIFIGLAAAGGAVWRFITGRRRKEEDVYTPSSADAGNEPPANV
jgi:uncharacterized membrane-anchored protein